MSIKDKERNIDYDGDTNIFYSQFLSAINRINQTELTLADAKKIIGELKIKLDNDDLGKSFFQILQSDIDGIKLIDFNDISGTQNDYTVVTELPYENSDDNFRPDIVVLINGMPLSFIEVKRHNNREGILTERSRMERRFGNKIYRRFVGITQFTVFSNNNEYDDSDIEPIQGAFYASSSYKRMFFSKFREQREDELKAKVKAIDSENEAFILSDTNLISIKGTPEYASSLSEDSPTNRIITSLYTKERLLFLLKYGICYKTTTNKDGITEIEKHIMRYPQLFATLAIRDKLREGVRKGVIWHTQGSGKTALAYSNVRFLTDYFSKEEGKIAKFYFIVDRLDLAEQAKNEFEARGLKVKLIKDKEEFITDITNPGESNTSGKVTMTVINIQKFSKDSVTKPSDYNVDVQRVYFLDEAHRSYNPTGSFLANLMASDRDAVQIALTGTPLIGDGYNTKDVFGNYIHKYYYNQSIADGYTLKLIRILSNVKSPSLYMQAAFRAQNPCLFSNNGQYYRKENAYVFDFDPARTLNIFEKFANDLSIETSDGRGYIDKRKENIRSLLNFFPVIGEDENGKMIELDAEKVLSIPRKIRSQEVVRSGFISNFLFQNVYNIFHAPMKVRDIIDKLAPVKERKKNVNLPADTEKEFPLDENGDIALSDKYVTGRSDDIFGDKIFDDIPKKLKDTINNIEETKTEKEDEQLENLKEVFHKGVVEGLIEIAEKEYDSNISRSDKKKLERKLKANSDDIINKAYGEHSIAKKKLEKEYANIFNKCKTDEDLKLKNQEFEEKNKAVAENLKEVLSDSVNEFVKSAGEEIVRTVETKKREQEKKSIEDSVRDHLRGFSRTIPAFLMAYGDDAVTLENFDKVIPDEVFLEVTSITLDQFRFLRDGGSYKDESTGEEKQFVGNLFDPVVFNDSIKEFLRLKIKLANYFEETSTEDIFDYIPSQKTNQIFTPKWVVKKMVDMLEEENPGCFDMPDKTFIDLYMKSGLYIAEIVKRLYQSKEIQKLYPDREERLKHIFKEQVYGLAPTEIIFNIATNFILGFDNTLTITEHNFKQMDTLECIKNGTLEQSLDILYGQNKKDK